MSLITFEGIDGSGKSTQIALLKEWLGNKGISVEVYREPGGTELSEKVRALLLDNALDIHPRAELLLFSAARAQLIEEAVKPALLTGKWVVLDRFFDSSTAYQGYGRAIVDIEALNGLNTLATGGLTPDLSFYLRIPFDVSVDRRQGQHQDRMEAAGEAFFEKVIQGYDAIAASEERFRSVDATQTVDQIHAEIVAYVSHLLKA